MLYNSQSLKHKKATWKGGFELERVKGFEPSTSTLARLRSTPELHPRSVFTLPDYNDCFRFCNKNFCF